MNIEILECPIDLGASRHGSDMGPKSLKLAGLSELLTRAGHTITAYKNVCEEVLQANVLRDVGYAKAKYLVPIVKACTLLAQAVEAAHKAGDFPLVLGGDHSVALGSIAGTAAWAKGHAKRLGVLYVDAHGDFNTDETTPSGNIHGQCLAASAGYGLDELRNLYYVGKKVRSEDVAIVGVRDLDGGERELLKTAGARVYTMSEIERRGFNKVAQEVSEYFQAKVDAVHVSFDMDAIDPMFAPGVGIQVNGGISNREALLLMEEIGDTGKVVSAEVVEVNPARDVRNSTAELAVKIIARLLGERVY